MFSQRQGRQVLVLFFVSYYYCFWWSGGGNGCGSVTTAAPAAAAAVTTTRPTTTTTTTTTSLAFTTRRLLCAFAFSNQQHCQFHQNNKKSQTATVQQPLPSPHQQQQHVQMNMQQPTQLPTQQPTQPTQPTQLHGSDKEPTTTTTTESGNGTQQQELVLPRQMITSPFLTVTQQQQQRRPRIHDNNDDNVDDNNDNEMVALVILNTPIPMRSAIFPYLWETTSFRVCADGGANRLYEYSHSTNNSHDNNNDDKDDENNNNNNKDRHCLYIPDLIIGDLDSIQSHVRTYYETIHGVPVICHDDQNYNDLDKSLQAIVRHEQQQQHKQQLEHNKQQQTQQQQQQPLSLDKDPSQSSLQQPNRSNNLHNNNNNNDCTTTTSTTSSCFIYGAFGGRFDQEMASIQALFVHATNFPQGLWLYNDDNAALLLQPNQQYILSFPNYYKNQYQYQDDDDDDEKDKNQSTTRTTIQWVLGEGPTCGLIPLGMPCESVTTRGLQWNLQNQSLAFGGLVSSSNHLIQSTIEIETSHPLIFTIEIQQTNHDEEPTSKQQLTNNTW